MMGEQIWSRQSPDYKKWTLRYRYIYVHISSTNAESRNAELVKREWNPPLCFLITSRHLHQDLSSCCPRPTTGVIECHFYLHGLRKVIVSAIQSCPKELNWVKQSPVLQYLTAIKSTQAWDVVRAVYSGLCRFQSDPPVTRRTFHTACNSIKE